MAEKRSAYLRPDDDKFILVVSESKGEIFYDIDLWLRNESTECVKVFYPMATGFYYLDDLLLDNSKWNTYRIFIESKH